MSESFAVRRCRVTVRLRTSELREAMVERDRRVHSVPGAFAPEEIELARLAADKAQDMLDLAGIDLEEALSAG